MDQMDGDVDLDVLPLSLEERAARRREAMPDVDIKVRSVVVLSGESGYIVIGNEAGKPFDGVVDEIAEAARRATQARCDREAVRAVAIQAARLFELYEAMAAQMYSHCEINPVSVLEEAKALFRVELARRRHQRKRQDLKWPFSLDALDEALGVERRPKAAGGSGAAGVGGAGGAGGAA